MRVDDEKGCAVPVDKETWLEAFPHLESVIRRFGSEGRWDVFSEVVCTSWSKGRVSVVGDAAHALPPNLGQGANLSFANSIALAAALDETSDVETALRRWERRERPITDHTQRWSNVYGTVCEHWPRKLSDVRSFVVWATGHSDWLNRKLSRAARHAPAGTNSAGASPALGVDGSF